MANIVSGSILPLDFSTFDITGWFYMNITTSRSNYILGDYRFLGDSSYRTEFFGSNFTYNALGLPISGIVTGIRESSDFKTVLNVDNIFVTVRQLNDWIVFGNTSEFLSFGLSGNDLIIGSPFNDFVYGLGGSDRFIMGSGNDIVIPGSGNDNIDGGLGIDTAVFNGSQNLYSLSYNNDNRSYTVTGPEGIDILSSIEIIQFSDGNAWIEQAAGQTNGVHRFLTH